MGSLREELFCIIPSDKNCLVCYCPCVIIENQESVMNVKLDVRGKQTIKIDLENNFVALQNGISTRRKGIRTANYLRSPFFILFFVLFSSNLSKNSEPSFLYREEANFLFGNF